GTTRMATSSHRPRRATIEGHRSRFTPLWLPPGAQRPGRSQSEAVPHPQGDLVGDGRGQPTSKTVDQTGDERPAHADRRTAGGDVGELRRHLDRSLDVADLVNESYR